MIIETKFSLNDKVYYITRDYKTRFISCSGCAGTGLIKLKDGTEHMCPVCYGKKGKNVREGQEWGVRDLLTIGAVKYEIINVKPSGTFVNIGHHEEGLDEQTVSYMAYETGVGSGTIWDENKLFSTKKEAQKECDRLNLLSRSEGNLS